MNRDDARAYFESKGLTYHSVTLPALRYLAVLLNEQFIQQKKERLQSQSSIYWERINDAKYYKGEYDENGKLICAYLTGKGSYFSAREVISFNRNGFIGFCGEADDKNTAPVLTAFCKWCDWLAALGGDGDG